MGHHPAGCRPSDPSSGRALLRMTVSESLHPIAGAAPCDVVVDMPYLQKK